jgi:predicted nucleotidyltransferase
LSDNSFTSLGPAAYTGVVIDALRHVLSEEPSVAYALLFGSTARQTSHPFSDVDVAIGTSDGSTIPTFTLGQLTSRLEDAAGRAVHLVVLDEASPGLAYRVFKDGKPLLIRDERAYKFRLARAILEYLDFRPFEEIFTRGVLRASDGR